MLPQRANNVSPFHFLMFFPSSWPLSWSTASFTISAFITFKPSSPLFNSPFLRFCPALCFSSCSHFFTLSCFSFCLALYLTFSFLCMLLHMFSALTTSSNHFCASNPSSSAPPYCFQGFVRVRSSCVVLCVSFGRRKHALWEQWDLLFFSTHRCAEYEENKCMCRMMAWVKG